MTILKPYLVYYFFILSTFLAGWTNPASAQSQPDSTQSQSEIQRTKLYQAFSSSKLIPDTSYHYPDTTLSLIQRTPPYKDQPDIPLGLSGQKYYPIIPDADFFIPRNSPDFNFFHIPFRQHQLNSQTSYRNFDNSFTKLTFITGSGGEQLFDVFHVQNIKKPVTLYLEGKKLYSDGVYPSNLGDIGTGRAGLNVRYKRLRLLAEYSFLNSNIQENGGILDSIDLSSFVGTDVGSMPVNLSDAFNVTKQKRALADLSLSIFGSTNDSLKNDFFTTYAGLQAEINGFRRVYSDGPRANGFYPINYISSLGSKDSSAHTSQSLKPYLKVLFGPLTLAAAYKLSAHSVYMQFQREFVNHIPQLEATFKKDLFQIRTRLETNVYGYNQGDYRAHGEIAWSDSTLGTLKANVQSGSFSPYFAWTNYFSNHYIWDSTFSSTGFRTATFSYSQDTLKLDASVEWISLSRPIMLNGQGLPQQYNGNHNLIRLRVNKTFRYRKLFATPEISWQNGSSYFQIPQFAARLNLFLETDIFKNALRVQPGIDFNWYSSFSPYNYSPALQNFTRTNTGYKAGSFPYLDVYLSFRVKTVRAFVMLENSITGIAGYNYFIMENYPAANRNLKLGLVWNFFN